MTQQSCQIRNGMNQINNFRFIERMYQQSELVELGAVHMTQEHVEEVKELLAAGFLERNQIWSTFGIKREQIMEFFDRVVRSHIESEKRTRQFVNKDACLNTVFFNQGKITACKLHHELDDYLLSQKSEKPEKLDVFREIEKAGKELTKDIQFDHYPKGKTAFINFGGYHPTYEPPNLLKAIMVIELNLRLKQSGFDWVVGRLSNAKAMGLYRKFGAKTLNEITFEQHGKQFKLFFFEMDLRGEKFCSWEAKLEKMMEMEKEKLKQSKL